MQYLFNASYDIKLRETRVIYGKALDILTTSCWFMHGKVDSRS